MSKSMWIIAMMGFITVMIIVVAMLLSLTMFQQSPASNRARLAQEVKNEFGFPEVGSDVRDILGRTVLIVSYESPVDSKYDLAVQKAEMEKVATFVEGKYDGDDRRSIQELRVRRREVKARGCWKKLIESDHSIQNPRFPAPKSPLRTTAPGERMVPNLPPDLQRR
jgi:hypothetical protein